MGRSRNKKLRRRLERLEGSPESKSPKAENAPSIGSAEAFDLKAYEDAIAQAERSGLDPEHVRQLRLSVEYLREIPPEEYEAAGVVFRDANRAESVSPEEASS